MKNDPDDPIRTPPGALPGGEPPVPSAAPSPEASGESTPASPGDSGVTVEAAVADGGRVGHALPPIADGPTLPAPAEVPPRRRMDPIVYRLLGLLAVAPFLALFLDGEWGSFFMGSWEVSVVSWMCVLAYLGEERPWARNLSWVLLGVLLLGGLGLNLASVSMVLESDATGAEGGELPESSQFGVYALIGLATLWAAGTAGLVASRSVRPIFAWLTGTDEWTHVRILALATVVSVTLVAFVPLVGLGEPPLLAALANDAESGGLPDDGRGRAGMLRDDMYALCWVLLAAVLSVGFGVRRTWSESLERLGLARPGIRLCGVAVLLTALLLGGMQVLDWGVTGLWEAMDWPVTDMESVEALFEGYISPWGAVVIGITAGVGEEVAVRGILQPRMGILLSNLFFAALHAYQYHWDGVLVVFMIGLMLGWIRRWSSTTLCAMVHGSYDFALVIFEILWPESGGSGG